MKKTRELHHLSTSEIQGKKSSQYENSALFFIIGVVALFLFVVVYLFIQ